MKVIGIIQARYNSTRLPGKVCKEINGLPLLWHIYRRLLKCEELDEVVVAYGNCDWKPIVDICNRYFMANTGGPETDLITRIKDVCNWRGAMAFVRVTADCLFHDPYIIDKAVMFYKGFWPKCRLMASWPERVMSEGLDYEIMSTELLSELDTDKDCPREDFMTYAINKHGQKQALTPMKGEDLHLSIDTQEDFDQAEKMLEYLGNDRWSYVDTKEAYRHVHAGK